MKPLTLAIADYDRIAALTEGSVTVPGIDLDVQELAPSETFYRMLKEDAFDMSEMSMASYVIARSQGRPWVGVPVFPFRSMFHTGIYVREDAGIDRPQDLVGRRIGLTEYHVTAAVWTRGTLEDDFGVAPSSVEWFVERLPELSHSGVTGFQPPADVSVQPTGDRGLGEMLLAGDLDAVLPGPYPGMPTRLNRTDEIELQRMPGVRRLFSDPVAEMARYWHERGYLHANHLLVIQQGVVDRYPDLPMRLFQAFVEAKQVAYDRLGKLRRSSLVLAGAHLAEQQRAIGDDPYPYGFAANRPMLARLLAHFRDQGIIADIPEPEDLFSADTLTT